MLIALTGVSSRKDYAAPHSFKVGASNIGTANVRAEEVAQSLTRFGPCGKEWSENCEAVSVSHDGRLSTDTTMEDPGRHTRPAQPHHITVNSKQDHMMTKADEPHVIADVRPRLIEHRVLSDLAELGVSLRTTRMARRGCVLDNPFCNFAKVSFGDR